MERTYIMLKPDAVKRGLMGEIIARIEKKGYTITRMEMKTLEEATVKEHYAHISHLDIFPDLVQFMISGPVVCMIVEGNHCIQGMRGLMGPTNSSEGPGGTIRGDYASSSMFNLIHGSDSPETAEIEIKRFFGEGA